MSQRIKSIVVLTVMLMITAKAYALSQDRHSTLLLTSATANLNFETGISIYEGKVKLNQGTTQLLADKLVVHTDKQSQLQQAIATGKPAQYRTLPQLNKPEFHADANTIEYYPKKNLIILIGNARAYQNNNVYKGPRIEYHTESQTVISPESDAGRTTIIIQQKQPSAAPIH